MGTAQVKQAVHAVALRSLPSSIRVVGQLDRKCESCGPEDESEMIQRSAEASTRSPPAEAEYHFSQLPIMPAAPLAVSEPDDASEREADRVAEHVGAVLASDAAP